MPEALDTEVGDGGDLLSVGERQLLCLSRAVLRDSTILVMDECTASGSSRTQSSSVDASVSHLKCAVVAAVDVRTDAEIQTMIRQVFAGCTVFAIGAFPLSIVCAVRCAESSVGLAAHRLGTIIDYDRIVVLENARMVEFGARPTASRTDLMRSCS